MPSSRGEGYGLPSRSRPARGAGVGTAGKLDAVRVVLLGGFRVSVGARTIEEGGWRLRKAASLVKLLALAPGHRLHRERALELLWPDLGAKAAANNLSYALHVARRTLAPEPDASGRYLRLRDAHLELCPESPLWIDVRAFEEAAAAARRAGDPASYRAAVDLYAGDLLPGDRYEDWAENRREGLRRLYVTLLFELGRSYEVRGEHGQAVEAFERTVAAEPAHEEAHVDLMRLYAAGGQPFKAVLQYEQLQKNLHGRLSGERGAGRRLYRELLAGRLSVVRPAVESLPENRERPTRHNLPEARSSFVGREREIVEVKRALAMTRLLTLTGSGGCGKTGFEYGGDDIGMAADLSTLPGEVPTPKGFAVERVRDEEGLAAWVETLGSGFGEGPVEAEWVGEMYRRLGFGEEGPLRHYLERLGGEPVATATLFLGAGVAGVYFVSTVERIRRRGIGAAITLAALREARDLGHETAVLGSSQMGYPVYRRLGFEERCRIGLYEWHL